MGSIWDQMPFWDLISDQIVLGDGGPRKKIVSNVEKNESDR